MFKQKNCLHVLHTQVISLFLITWQLWSHQHKASLLQNLLLHSNLHSSSSFPLITSKTNNNYVSKYSLTVFNLILHFSVFESVFLGRIYFIRGLIKQYICKTCCILIFSTFNIILVLNHKKPLVFWYEKSNLGTIFRTK